MTERNVIVLIISEGLTMGKNFRETLEEQLQDPKFKAKWDALAPERQIMRAIVEERES